MFSTMLTGALAVICCASTLVNYSLAKPLEYASPNFKQLHNKNLIRLLSSSKQNNNINNGESNSDQLANKLDKASIVEEILFNPQSYGYSDGQEIPSDSILDNQNIPYYLPDYTEDVNDYGNNNNDYLEQKLLDTNGDNGVYYADGQDGWFDGPVVPKISQVPADNSDSELNKLLINYLYDKYNKMYDDEKSEDISELSTVDKRRQKVIIKDDNSQQVTTPKPALVTSTSATSTSTEVSSKVVPFHNRATFSRHGQKEVAQLRPAESKQKEEWPSELEENNLSEEESLKELPLKAQHRTVRDVLTSQLDSLKNEAHQESNVTPSEQHSNSQDAAGFNKATKQH